MILPVLFGFLQERPATPQGGGSLFSMLLMMGLVFVIFYVLIILPSRKKQKKHQVMIEQLKSGDKIITTGGIYGTVMGVQKDRIELKVGSNVKVEITKQAVGVILTPPSQEKK